MDRPAGREIAASATVLLAELDPDESAGLLAATVRALGSRPRVLIGPRGDQAFYGQPGRIGQLYTFELFVIDVHSCAVERAVFVSEENAADSAARRLDRVPAPVTVGERTSRADLRYAFGLSLANLPHGFEVEVAVENAFGPTRYTPYQVDGRPSFLVEPRSGSELSVTARWSP